jgi:hypothetical protein
MFCSKDWFDTSKGRFGNAKQKSKLTGGSPLRRRRNIIKFLPGPGGGILDRKIHS